MAASLLVRLITGGLVTGCAGLVALTIGSSGRAAVGSFDGGVLTVPAWLGSEVFKARVPVIVAIGSQVG